MLCRIRAFGATPGAASGAAAAGRRDKRRSAEQSAEGEVAATRGGEKQRHQFGEKSRRRESKLIAKKDFLVSVGAAN